MSNFYHMPILDVITLIIVVKFFVSILTSILSIVNPLIKGLTVTQVSDNFKRKSKVSGTTVRLLLNDIETFVVAVLILVVTYAYFFVHSHYTNISLGVTTLIVIAVDYLLYSGLNRERIVTGASY